MILCDVTDVIFALWQRVTPLRVLILEETCTFVKSNNFTEFYKKNILIHKYMYSTVTVALLCNEVHPVH